MTCRNNTFKYRCHPCRRRRPRYLFDYCLLSKIRWTRGKRAREICRQPCVLPCFLPLTVRLSAADTRFARGPVVTAWPRRLVWRPSWHKIFGETIQTIKTVRVQRIRRPFHHYHDGRQRFLREKMREKTLSLRPKRHNFCRFRRGARTST